VERDAALQAGAIDGAVTDPSPWPSPSREASTSAAASLTDRRYGIVASPLSGIASLASLAGKSIGISSNTIIQYAAGNDARPRRRSERRYPKPRGA